MTPSFRNANPEDAPALAALGSATFIETFGHLYRPEDLEAFLANHSVQSWREQLESSDFAVRIAEAGGEAVAYAKLGPVSLPVESIHPAIELKQLYVVGAWQGRGVARTLMDWVLEDARARGAREMLLSVWTENHRARRFYERYGFTFVGPYAFMVGSQADEDQILRLTLRETE